jgi:iron complex transport system substrate-binding protein
MSLLLLACGAPEARGAADCRERLVSLHDVTTEAVLRLGAGRCLVGVAEPTDLDATLYAQLRNVSRVESTETVLAARPTQVLALAIVAERQPELFRELDRRGIGWTASRLERVDDVAELARDLGQRVGAVAQSDAVVRGLTNPTAPRPVTRRRRVFVFDCCAPPFTAGRQAVLTDLLARAGAENIFADVDDDWFHASWEAAVLREPELVLIDDYGEPNNVANKRRALAQIAPLAGLPVVVLPLRDSLGTIRSAEVIERLAAAIHGSLG